ncbi:hypothetical protein G7074_13970 [Pedobacter sp. HDW13]|uniref:hypothetical protein n=1 Tax=Pedobacter sp. HDW13 TaxID=2714940 RepID=UPI001409443B|nr:hypothetical protein [Pedobacter sp. HDW13]QIL40269.1 hypothetical protein G7074_13970 [Pedobacter sp. HDW13]
MNGIYSAKTQPQKKEKSNNLAFSTKNHQTTRDKLFDGFKNPISNKIPPRNRTLSSMEIPDLPYTIPRLFKGKKIESVPKGSTWAKEEPLQSWYVEFFSQPTDWSDGKVQAD